MADILWQNISQTNIMFKILPNIDLKSLKIISVVTQ